MSNGRKQEVKIAFPNELKGGVYSNNMLVTHTKEEFVMDFLMVIPPAGAVTSRVVISPGHMKRMINALKINVKKVTPVNIPSKIKLKTGSKVSIIGHPGLGNPGRSDGIFAAVLCLF